MTAGTLGASEVSRAWRSYLWDARLHLGLAIVFGFVLRFWKLASSPPGLNQDEAVYAYDAYSIWKTGRDHLGHPFPFTSIETFGDWSSPLLTYLTIPAVAIFGLHIEVIRAVSSLIGVAAIPLVFALATVMFRRVEVAVAAAWTLALLPWAVHMSRWAIIPTTVPTMVAAAMLALVWSLEHRSERGFVAAILLAALTVAAYHSMKVYVPLLLLATAAVYWRRILELRLEALAYAAVVFIVVVGPIFWLSVRDPGGGARLAQTSVFNEHDVTPWLLAEQYLAYFSPRFWFVSGDNNPMHLPAGEGLVPVVTIPLLLAGVFSLVWMARRGNDVCRRSSTLLLLALVLYPIAGMLTVPNPHVLRAVHVLPLIALISGIGAVSLYDLATRVSAQPWLTRVAATTAAVLLLLGSIEVAKTYDHYFRSYPEEVARRFHHGMEDALAYVREKESEVDEVWIRGQNSAYVYVLFFASWDPSDVHSNLVVRRNPPEWNVVESLGKYHFGEPPEMPSAAVVFTTKLPDGHPAYEVLSATRDGKMILVIQEASQTD